MNTFLLTWNPGPDNDKEWDPASWHDEMVQPTMLGEVVKNNWSVGKVKSIIPGDRVYLYRQGQYGRGVVGAGEVTSPPWESLHWDGSGKTATYVDVQWQTCLPLKERLTVEELQDGVPNFKWKNVYNSGRQVHEPNATLLRDLWDNRVGVSEPVEDASSVFYGEPHTNPEVEAAGMEVVAHLYVSEGYNVVDVSEQKCGWDLTATSTEEELHLEVKGVAGPDVSAFLTRNEYRHAEADPTWRLLIVTSCLTSPLVHEVDPETAVHFSEPVTYRVDVPAELFS